MTVVKCSILAVLAGGFCTLLGVGMWMGPQETACKAQSPGTAVRCDDAVRCKADGPCKAAACCAEGDSAACCSKSCDAALAVATTCAAANGACASGACEAAICPDGTCDLVAECAPVADVACESGYPSLAGAPALPPVSNYVASATCENGVCYAAPVRQPMPVPGQQMPLTQWAPASMHGPAPCVGPPSPHPVYSHPAIAPAFVASGYPSVSYAYAEAPSPVASHEQLIEAIFEEREARYEAKVEAIEAQAELQLEAQEAVFKAQHEAEIATLKAEASLKIAELTQALREEKALLHLVADGTISTQALQTMIARNHAHSMGPGHHVSTQSVATEAGCKCEKCACETCKCGTDAACKCGECKCEGCACPGCEKAVSVSTKACPTGTCKPCGDACSTEATSCKACETECKACEPCQKECGACKLSAQALEVIGVDFDFVCDEGGCTIAVKGEPQGCRNLTVQRSEVRAPSKSGQNGAEPFICEQDGCETRLIVAGEEIPVLSKIPYIGRLFENETQVLPSPYYSSEDVQYFPPDNEFKAQRN